MWPSWWRATGSLWLALPVAIVGGILLGLLLERGLFRYFYDARASRSGAADLRADPAVRGRRSLLVGNDFYSVPVPAVFDFSVPITAGFSYSAYRFAVIGVCLALAALLFFWIERTKMGAIIRAAAEKPEMVDVLGIDARRVHMTVFAIGTALALVAGVLAAPLYSVYPNMGDGFLIISFVVVVIGGLGSVSGAFWSALVIGLVDTLGKAYGRPRRGPRCGDAAVAYAGLRADGRVLLWRPSGLFGQSAHDRHASLMLPRTLRAGVGLAARHRAACRAAVLRAALLCRARHHAMISAMLALSLQLLVGCTGLVSLGHAAFYGLAAYTVYLITPRRRGPSILYPAGRYAGRGLAALAGRRAVAAHQGLLLPDGDARLRADGVLPVPRHQARRRHRRRFLPPPDSPLSAGASRLPRARPIADLLRGARPAGRHVPRARLLLRSLFGRVLEGIRVNEHRMQALGFNTYRYKLAAFVIAGLLAGVAGHMWACTAAS